MQGVCVCVCVCVGVCAGTDHVGEQRVLHLLDALVQFNPDAAPRADTEHGKEARPQPVN